MSKINKRECSPHESNILHLFKPQIYFAQLADYTYTYATTIIT